MFRLELLARLPAQSHPNNLKFTARNAAIRYKSRRTAAWCGHIALREGRGSLAGSTVVPLLLQALTAETIHLHKVVTATLKMKACRGKNSREAPYAA